MTYYSRFSSPMGDIVLAGDERGLSHLCLDTESRTVEAGEKWTRDDERFSNVRQQLQEYFQGRRKTFDVPLNPQGTDFQRQVWDALRAIPYGQVRSYRDVAEAVGNPGASRAVGMANSKNPIPIIVPCHRVVGSNGKLTGFALGLDVKARLLDIEGVETA